MFFETLNFHYPLNMFSLEQMCVASVHMFPAEFLGVEDQYPTLKHISDEFT